MALSLRGLAASLLFNVALPALWLMYVSRQVDWSAMTELCVGLAFPFTYGIAQALVKRTLNPLSVLSLISILLTAAVGFIAPTRFWFAVKGATTPSLVSLGILVQRQKVALFLRTFLADGPLLNGPAIARSLAAPTVAARLDAVLATATGWLILHFLFNGALNAAWNWLLVTADPGTTLFNEQYGELLARNLYLVALPCVVSILTIVLVTARRIRELTGLSWKALLDKPVSAKEGSRRT